MCKAHHLPLLSNGRTRLTGLKAPETFLVCATKEGPGHVRVRLQMRNAAEG